MTNESDYKLHFPALILIRLSFLSLSLSLSLCSSHSSDQSGRVNVALAHLFYSSSTTAYLHLSSFVIILHARITKTTHSGSVQFRLLVRTISRYSCQLVPTFILVPLHTVPPHPGPIPSVRVRSKNWDIFFRDLARDFNKCFERSPNVSRIYIGRVVVNFLLGILRHRSIRGAASLISTGTRASAKKYANERAARPARYSAGDRWGRGCYIVAEAKE